MKNARGSATSHDRGRIAGSLQTNGFRVVKAKIGVSTGECPDIRRSAVLRGEW
jgi:hypothetical protein